LIAHRGGQGLEQPCLGDGAPRPGARVENHGTITLRDQGLAALVGPVAANSGTIRARMGRVAIAATGWRRR
jgi:hypothetical protein